MRRRHELTDAVWERLQPLLPPRKPGKPRVDDRRLINGIVWKRATGAPWRALPERYGPWQTVYTRCRRWTKAGVWDGIFAAVPQQADAAGDLQWEVHFVDGTVVRAHQHAAGAQGGTLPPRPWAAARGASPPRSISAPRAAVSR